MFKFGNVTAGLGFTHQEKHKKLFEVYKDVVWSKK